MAQKNQTQACSVYSKEKPLGGKVSRIAYLLDGPPVFFLDPS